MFLPATFALCTLFGLGIAVPESRSLDPVHPETGAPQAVLVHEFTDSLGLAGIAEYEPDIFAVISGMFNIPTGDSEGTFLFSDINAGVVYRLDTQGSYEVVINSTLTKSVPTPPVPLTGVGGLHVHHDGDLKTLHFVNAGQGFLASVAINDDETPAGEMEIVA
ncbi:hypothetical protein THAR02_09959 [Trichoderma harzianum]|uniref:Uncharacterized protein n=1 Tax=Trichoderma harzianum TaxID=5544 RepID=A0A0F9XB64_TRIHA|nr:hypothetical protein THAR02_09959 [Trichoderma harzianum]